MNLSGKPNNHFASLRVLLSVMISLSLLWQGLFSAQASPLVVFSGLVGSGTATSCDEPALDGALAGAGLVIFNCGPAPVTITITSVKTITQNTTIDGAGLITFSTLAVTPTPLFTVNTGATLRLQNLTLNGGNAGAGNGGALANYGAADLYNVTLSANHGTNGGAIYNEGVLNLDSVTANNNSANLGGVLYNTVSPGGTAAGLSQLTNVTFNGNSAPFGGGAIYNNQNILNLTNATIDGNAADGGGGAIFNNASTSGTVTLLNTVLGPNSTPSNCSGPVTSSGFNLSTDATCNLGQSSDLSSTSSVLGALLNNGGSTQTQMLLNGSPAIDSGDNFHCPAVDQRGLPRPFGAGCDRGAVEVQVSYGSPTGPWYVSQAGSDANPCFLTSAPCKTINAAIGKAAPSDTIYVAQGFYSSPSGDEVVKVSKSVQIEGGWNSAFTAKIGLSTIEGRVTSLNPPTGQRGVTIMPGVTAWLSGFTIENGAGIQASVPLPSGGISGAMGGGLFVDGQLHASQLHITGNKADYGAGIEVTNNGTLYLSQSTVDNNEVSYTGGGINAQNSGGLIVVNSTIASNILDYCPTCSFRGSEIDDNYGSMLMAASTVLSNYGTFGDATVAAIRDNAANIGLLSTILVGAQPCEQAAFITSWGYNLESKNTCGLTGSNDHVNTDPILGPLQNNGGFTPTYALPYYSPAVDAAGNCAFGADQRGVARPQGAGCDIGAYEYSGFQVLLLTSAASLSFPIGLGTISGGSSQGLYNGIIGVLLPAGSAPSGSTFVYTPDTGTAQALPTGMQAIASFGAQVFTGGVAAAQPLVLPSPFPQLTQPMTLTLSYATLPAGVPPATLTLMWFNPSSHAWVDLPAAINLTAQTVTVQTLHLGEFVLAGGLREIFLPLLMH